MLEVHVNMFNGYKMKSWELSIMDWHNWARTLLCITITDYWKYYHALSSLILWKPLLSDTKMYIIWKCATADKFIEESPRYILFRFIPYIFIVCYLWIGWIFKMAMIFSSQLASVVPCESIHALIFMGFPYHMDY